MVKNARKSNENTTKEAQKTTEKAQETPPEVDTETSPETPGSPREANGAGSEAGADETPETSPEVPETRDQYAFPKVNPCPRCHATDTVATSTQGKVQYRQCTRAICRDNFKVIGQKIVFTDCKQAD